MPARLENKYIHTKKENAIAFSLNISNKILHCVQNDRLQKPAQH
jgi:hypothetical protein